MSQTTPDVRQLCPHCGSDITWTKFQEEGEDPLYAGHCHYCGWELLDVSEPARELEPGEARLLPRIAELEAAQRWRVTAEEAPPEGVQVLALRADDPGWTYDVVVRLGRGAWASSVGFTGQPDRWQPIARAASSQGADVPKEQ